MARYALLPAALLLSLGAASAAPSHFGPPEIADGLSARAGIGGVARPGRWLPVDVTIASQPSGVRGELRVEWGDAVVLRDLDIAGGTLERGAVEAGTLACAPATIGLRPTRAAEVLGIDISPDRQHAILTGLGFVELGPGQGVLLRPRHDDIGIDQC